MDVAEFLLRVLKIELMDRLAGRLGGGRHERQLEDFGDREAPGCVAGQGPDDVDHPVAHLVVERSEEHTSELQSLMRISYAVFCLKKKNTTASKKHHRHKTLN